MARWASCHAGMETVAVASPAWTVASCGFIWEASLAAARARPVSVSFFKMIVKNTHSTPPFFCAVNSYK